MHNLFACLVHEAPDCVADLVANLRCLDPDSLVLLYDGSSGGHLLTGYHPPDDHVLIHPRPRPMVWGRLHGFAVDCLRFALDELDVDAVTVVDSDQLLLRAGYSRSLEIFLAEHPGVGCLSSSPGPQPRGTVNGPTRSAWAEIDAWRPYLDRFPAGESLFPQWTFWPSTVFTRAAAQQLVDLWADPQLQELVAVSRITATEEVLLPTLAALGGAPTVMTPFNQHCVQFRRRYKVTDLQAALRHDSTFWVHPVARTHDDPLRTWIRDWNGGYTNGARAASAGGGLARGRASSLVSCIMLTRDRRRFVSLAVGCFLRQDHPDRELVVVDDGADPVADLMPDHPSVRYLRLSGQRSLGARRNIACAQARGDLILHWDDDGWSAPWRVRYQAEALLNGGPDVAGLRTTLFCDLGGEQGWRYEYPRQRRPWLSEATACYRKASWERCPHHEDASEGSAGFALAAWGSTATALADPSFYVAMMHPGRTGPAGIGGPWWHPVPVAMLADLLGKDWLEYRRAARPDPGGT